jgi:signal transduction histidine kinase
MGQLRFVAVVLRKIVPNLLPPFGVRSASRRAQETELRNIEKTYRLFPGFPVHLESEFKRYYNESSMSVARGGVFLGICVYLAFYFWDVTIDYPQSTNTFLIRLGISVCCTLLLLLPRATFARHLQVFVGSLMTIAGLGIVAIISILTDGFNIGLSGVVLSLMFNFGFLRLLFIPSLVAGVIICLGYNAAAYSAGVGAWLIAANNFFLISALISGASITYLLERLFRTQFLTAKELVREREALARQHQADIRYLTWLRRLATFLRHEVRQPVAQINSSIELIQLTHEDDERLKPHVASALVSIEHVWNLIERASRATDAEAFVRQSQLVEIDLHPLLVELLEGHRQTYSGIDIQLRAQTSIWTRADSALIKEAVSNLVSNAVSFARDNSKVELALELKDQQAIIRVQNEGPLLLGDPELLFGPFTSTRNDPSSEHYGLGLYLVRLIAEHHGGSAVIANLGDGSGVEASIWLPVLGF